MQNRHVVVFWLFCLMINTLILSSNAQCSKYTETFNSSQYCNKSMTTAWWDTIGGELKNYPFYRISPLAYADSCTSPDYAVQITVSGNHAFVTHWLYGIYILDITNAGHPTYLSDIEIEPGTHDVAVRDNYAYVTAHDSGLVVIDVSDPEMPTLIGSYDGFSSANKVAIAGDYAFVTDTGFGILSVDISNPSNPFYADSCMIEGTYASEIALLGNYAYVTGGSLGLSVVDISDPLNLEYKTSISTGGFAVGVCIKDNFAYVGDRDGYFVVIDITDPLTPVKSASCPLSASAYYVDIIDHYAFVTGRGNGIWELDISNPLNPIVIDSCPPRNLAIGIDISGEYAYIADCDSGVTTVKISDHLTRNFAQSTIIDHFSDEILKIRMNTTQVDSIMWELSPDGGIDWQQFWPNGQWQEFSTPGSNLLWRANLFRSDQSTPSCSDLELEWLYNFAIIDSIVDVPDDQGGWVRLYFSRSALDFADSPTPILAYDVFRRIDDISLFTQIIQHGQLVDEQETRSDNSGNAPIAILPERGVQTYLFEDKIYLIPEPAMFSEIPPGLWEGIGSLHALQQDQYTFLAPTLTDSLSELTWKETAYCICAHTTTPSIYYFSPPDSGYSIDNISPEVPSEFGITYNYSEGTGDNRLFWTATTSTDLQYYNIYRCQIGSGDWERLSCTVQTQYIDTDGGGSRWTYMISAVDHAGNESIRILAEPGLITDAGEPIAAVNFKLYQNVPNPFNPATRIRFDLPRSTVIKLTIFNVKGQTIRNLYEGGVTAGRKEFTWDGRDDKKGLVASGVYFYRLEAGEYSKTMKMILLR